MVGETLRNLLLIAWLLPLCGFAVEIFGGFWGSRRSRVAAWLAVGCIATGFVCSASALTIWGKSNGWAVLHRADHHESSADGGGPAVADATVPPAAEAVPGAEASAPTAVAGQHAADEHSHSGADSAKAQTVFSGTLYRLATFGGLELSLDY